MWDGSIELLQPFLHKLNQNNFHLNFTMTWDQSSTTFLDVTIYKDENGLLSSSLYRKPMAGNSILHASIFHPQALISSIPYSQYLRIRRNCSDNEVFKREADLLKARLLARGYSNTCLKKAFNRACTRTRRDLLYNPSSKTNKKNLISIITKFSNQHKKIKRIVEKYWHVLTLDPTIVPLSLLDEPDLSQTSWSPVNSRQMVLHGTTTLAFKVLITREEEYVPCKSAGTFTCSGCNYCQFLNTSKNLLLPNSEWYKLQHYANCKTPGVVYLLLCECACFYVGKTIPKSSGEELIATLPQ